MNQEYSTDYWVLEVVDLVDILHKVGVLHDYQLPWDDLHIVLKHVPALVHKIALHMDVVMAYDMREDVVLLENHTQEILEIHPSSALRPSVEFQPSFQAHHRLMDPCVLQAP